MTIRAQRAPERPQNHSEGKGNLDRAKAPVATAPEQPSPTRLSSPNVLISQT